MTAVPAGSRELAALVERVDPRARPRLDVRERDGVPYLEARLPGPFRAVFTTRHGGSSADPYATLNLDARSDDEPEAVRRNRSRLNSLMRGEAGDRPAEGVSATPLLVSPLQVHGTRVVGAAEYVSGPRPGSGEGAANTPCDGLTLHPELDRGLAPLLLFADCVPIVMVGEVDMAVVHGGWRGIIGEIVQQGARAMTGPPGLAVVGPSIGPCCFEVADDVAQAFARRFGSQVVKESGHSPRVDLWAAVERALDEVGVGAHQVVNPRLCTACNSDLFFSYRTDGPPTGRQGCLAWTADA